tara:strand:+ start:98 stop:3433 length:3336 start_codon:yes stop_codon:yes gene_type:complete
LKLKNKIILVTRLALVSSFLFASGVTNTKIPPTSIIQHTCATHSQDGGAVMSAGTCDHFESELVVYDYKINSISNISTDDPDFPQSVTMSRDGDVVTTFSYTGSSQTFTVPSGVSEITIQAWGAQGCAGHFSGGGFPGGKGGYATGSFSVSAGDELYVFVGQQPTATDDNRQGGGGGGATDVRYENGDGVWNHSAGLYSRIIVAGGGSGTHGGHYSSGTIGTGGGTEATVSYYNNLPSSTAASQFTGGTDNGNSNGFYSQYEQNGAFGYAGYAIDTPNSFGDAYGGWNGGGKGNKWVVGGGGGGWYGGATVWPQGGGGSGYVLTSSSHKPDGYDPSSSYYLSNTDLIAGNASMPNPDGGTMIGREGNGLVVISYTEVPPNTPPTATAQSVTGNEDSPLAITLAGNDPEGEVLTFALATNPSNGAVSLQQGSAEVTYTPNANYNGSDSFTFTVSDGESTSSPATVDISVTAVNDAPTAATQSVSGDEDVAQTITLVGSDVDGDGLTYVLATNPSNGTPTLSGNQVTYSPNSNYNGSDSFSFTVSDGEHTSSAATVSITVVSVNDLPVISSTPSLDALDGSLYEYSLSVSDVDEDVVAITATGPAWLTVDDGTLSGTPGTSDGGLHNIILSADDGNGGVVTQSYTLAVSLHSLEIADSGFRMFSSPVSGAIYGDLLEELWTQGAEGSDNPNSNPNIWTFDNGWWATVTNFTSDALTAGEGFLMYVYADTDFDGEDDLPVTISIDGAQQESGVSVVSEPSEWNLMGNPYGLSVDIGQMLSDNNGKFNSTIYALDLTNPGYKTHNGVVGNIENDEIKPFDGFWIQADSDGDVFEFTEQSIRKGSLNNAGRTITDDSNGSAVFTFTNGDYSSSTYLSFTPEGQINLDPADADRLVPMSPAEHLTSMIYESNKSLAINNLPFDLSTDISFPMDVMMLSPTDDGYATQTEQVDLAWDITDLPEGITLELTNNITGQNIDLTGELSATISLPSKGSFLTSGDFMGTYPVVGQSQFTLSVYGTLAAVADDVLPERLTLHSAYPNPFNPSTLIRFDLANADMVSLEIFDIAGRKVASLINEYMIPGNHQISWNPGSLSSGIYLVNLVVGTETFNEKITFIK